ncbi:MAG TPA: outer membrane beta-barrel protein [Candidatus Acidoferrales bacterium]|nr:outer membrane beta-barrel protein [Candidatus Acidoferrales bacterium]
MIRKLSTWLFAVMMVAFFASSASAQFENQKNYAGVHIGLSGVGSTLTLGADYERGITNPGEVGPGIIGIGGLLDYYHWSENELGFGGSWTYIDIGVSGMYHFVLDNKKWDPFLGLVLGYEIATWSWSGGSGLSSPTAGGFTLGGSAGIRYFLSDSWALQARVGFGFYIFAVGVDYKF